jgi:N-acetylneuraminate synthase
MAREVKIGNRWVGDGHPASIVAEIGVNHNGSVQVAKDLIKQAHHAGVDAVKFQKRTPELCVPRDQWEIMRETPWGYISYIEYRRKMEFQHEEYTEIDRYCKELGIPWFASVWDEPSVEFLESYQPICYKVPSASLTDHNLLRVLRETGRPVILSTGMSTMEQIRTAVSHLDMERLVICHATSTYPCDPHELNLHVIEKLREEFPCPIGYSGHEVGLITSVVAVALGACMVERHKIGRAHV